MSVLALSRKTGVKQTKKEGIYVAYPDEFIYIANKKIALQVLQTAKREYEQGIMTVSEYYAVEAQLTDYFNITEDML